MSADEIKALSQQAFVDVMASHRAGLHDWEVRCRQYAAALLAYAEMAERCEELKAQCLKICGRGTCDHKDPKCVCCARDVLDFVIRGDAGKDEK